MRVLPRRRTCRGLLSGVRYEGEQDLALKVPGIHNQLNASAAFISALISGYEAADIVRALAEFVGADRRFTLRGEVAGVKVFDDYAHHPTEVFRALETAVPWLMAITCT